VREMDLNSTISPTTNVAFTSTKAQSDSGSAAAAIYKRDSSPIEAAITEDLMHKPKYDLTVSQEAFVKILEKANKAVEGVQIKFEYSIHKKTGEIMVKMLNNETNEIIREIPSEKILDLVASFQEPNGIIIDEKR
jgi:flagellar protein FlaG